MLTNELKTKMDDVVETLYADGITNDVDVFEQITFLLFIKLLDDQQIKKEAAASIMNDSVKDRTFGDGTFKTDNMEYKDAIPISDLRWSNFRHFEPKRMYDTISKYVFPYMKTLQGDKNNILAGFMSEATFQIRNAKTLQSIVRTLDSLDMNNNDVMGDVYEYLLRIMAKKGNNGQYRTPRHIIDMMVELMKPKLGEKILDPAMGSAGFLVSCASYIKKNYSDELMNTNNLKSFRSEMFSGFDTDIKMVRIGAMNLLLHDIDHPNIKQIDSLSDENTERDSYDLIMANPPFFTPKNSGVKENFSNDIKLICNTTRTELLFVALFTKMLKIGGRCASIVPDSFLSGEKGASLSIRKELIDNQRLRAVISMPNGVFRPYAGVSTAIIIFDKTDHGGTDNVWFYDMKADGYSLDDKREPISENDIPDIIARFENPNEFNRSRKDQSFCVPKQEIIDNHYLLTINKYQKIEYDKEELPEPNEIMKDIKSIGTDILKDIEELEKLF